MYALCAKRPLEADWLNRTYAHTEYQILVIVNLVDSRWTVFQIELTNFGRQVFHLIGFQLIDFKLTVFQLIGLLFVILKKIQDMF